jgi:hypothetical protein
MLNRILSPSHHIKHGGSANILRHDVKNRIRVTIEAVEHLILLARS